MFVVTSTTRMPSDEKKDVGGRPKKDHGKKRTSIYALDDHMHELRMIAVEKRIYVHEAIEEAFNDYIEKNKKN